MYIYFFNPHSEIRAESNVFVMACDHSISEKGKPVDVLDNIIDHGDVKTLQNFSRDSSRLQCHLMHRC